MRGEKLTGTDKKIRCIGVAISAEFFPDRRDLGLELANARV